jgi:hypothetical protein
MAVALVSATAAAPSAKAATLIDTSRFQFILTTLPPIDEMTSNLCIRLHRHGNALQNFYRPAQTSANASFMLHLGCDGTAGKCLK